MLLAWLSANTRQTEAAREHLDKARAGVLPEPVKELWRFLFARSRNATDLR